MMTINTESKKRTLPRFGLRSFLIAVAFTCIGFAWLANEVANARRQELLVDQLRDKHAIVLYDYHANHDANEDPQYDFDKESPIPALLRFLLGNDFLAKPQFVYCESLSDGDVEILANLKSIKILQLERSPLTGQGLRHLRALTELQSLSLIGTEITDDSLAPLARIASLEQLDLSYTPISDAGLMELQEFTQLGLLSLRGTKCSDKGLRFLERLGNLTELDLTETDVSTLAVERLKTALPQCEIDYGFFFYDYDTKEFRHSPTRPPAMKVEYSHEQQKPPSTNSDERQPRVHGGVI